MSKIIICIFFVNNIYFLFINFCYIIIFNILFYNICFLAVTESLYSDANQQSIENLSEMSLEDDILGVLNISSDPESEWEISRNIQTRVSSPSNFQSEVN